MRNGGEMERAEWRHTAALTGSFSLGFLFDLQQRWGGLPGGMSAFGGGLSVGGPVALTAPDRAVLMGADDD